VEDNREAEAPAAISEAPPSGRAKGLSYRSEPLSSLGVSGSWLNLVERLFAELTERCVRRGSHTAVRSLEKAMLDYLDQRNKNPKPFVWTADADLILGKVARLSKRISNSGH
jgi:hypothetical protein